jgi:Carboxypeptidase regulatory-like domain
MRPKKRTATCLCEPRDPRVLVLVLVSCCLSLTFAHLAMASIAFAQTSTGVIRGEVQDSSGTVMVDVRVKLVDQATNQSWEQTTNEEGFFEFRALPFGKYKVEVEHSGFIKQVVEDVALQVAQTESLKVRLQVGSVNESIIVQATVDCSRLRTQPYLKLSMTSGSWSCRLTGVM